MLGLGGGVGNFVKHVSGICASLPLPHVVEYTNALLILVIVFDNPPPPPNPLPPHFASM